MVSEGERARPKERYAKVEAMKHIMEKNFDDLRKIALGCIPFKMLLAMLIRMASSLNVWSSDVSFSRVKARWTSSALPLLLCCCSLEKARDSRSIEYCMIPF